MRGRKAMGINFRQYAAMQQETELRTALIMAQPTFLSVPHANHDEGEGITSSRPPSPPDSGSTTPRVTIAPCPRRLTPLYPPFNYGCVDEGKIYRSAYPQDRNVAFMHNLDIKSVLTLVDRAPTLGVQYWLSDAGIRHAKLHIGTNKDAGGRVDVHRDSISQAILFLLDSSNHPVHVHCNQGKHRTGCVIACLRRVQGWALAEVLDEYNVYAGAKARAGDRALIKAFEPRLVFEFAKATGVVDGLARAVGWSPNHHDRILRHDSTIADVHALRAALDAGLLADVELEDASSSDSSLSPGPFPPKASPTLARALSGNVEVEVVKVAEFVEDTRELSPEVEMVQERTMREVVEVEAGC